VFLSKWPHNFNDSWQSHSFLSSLWQRSRFIDVPGQILPFKNIKVTLRSNGERPQHQHQTQPNSGQQPPAPSLHHHLPSSVAAAGLRRRRPYLASGASRGIPPGCCPPPSSATASAARGGWRELQQAPIALTIPASPPLRQLPQRVEPDGRCSRPRSLSPSPPRPRKHARRRSKGESFLPSSQLPLPWSVPTRGAGTAGKRPMAAALLAGAPPPPLLSGAGELEFGCGNFGLGRNFGIGGDPDWIRGGVLGLGVFEFWAVVVVRSGAAVETILRIFYFPLFDRRVLAVCMDSSLGVWISYETLASLSLWFRWFGLGQQSFGSSELEIRFNFQHRSVKNFLTL
jgi:hypothetical protein